MANELAALKQRALILSLGLIALVSWALTAWLPAPG